MATNTLNVRMKQAVRTEAEWTSDNPVLLEGEVAYSSDKNNMYKVGDGTHSWSALSYASGNIPAATTSTLGGVIVGDGLAVTNSGVLSATANDITITYSEIDKIIYITTSSTISDGDGVSY